MDRSKVLELAHEAELARQFALEVPFVVDRLQRFAALIEREVRGDAEPVARLRFYKGEVVVTKDYETVGRNGEVDVYTHPAPAADAVPVAWMYTLEYGDAVANKKVSLSQLNYPFGVCGADYLRENSDGMSYVRQTPLYTHPAPAVVRQPLTSEDIFDLAMSVFTRIQKDDWVATDKDIYDFVRSIERAHGIGGSDE